MAALRYRDVAKIAEEGAKRGLRFADAQTVERGSPYWVLRLRAPDGTLHQVDSWACWRALLQVLEPARRPPRTARPS